MLTAKEKSTVIKKVARGEKDTGSSEVQIVILSEEIRRLTLHLKKHPKDNHSRKGLLGMVVKRKKLLDYLKRTDVKRHATIAKLIERKK